MNTITAKELRDNLDKVVARAQAGEKIRVTYRSKTAFVIMPEQVTAKEAAPGSRKAVKQFLTRVRDRKQTGEKLVFDPGKPIKELYREMLDNDPKYKPPYQR